MTSDEWRRDGSTFTYDRHSIFYRDEGRGEVLLCIHGFPTASYDWWRLWKPLSARFRVVALDMLGFGFSAKPRDHAYTIAGQALLQETLLSALGIGRVHVLAHDYGDTVAQELLARHEDRGRSATAGPLLASVCLLNGGLFPETHHALPIQRLLAGPLGAVLGRFTTERAFARGFAPVFGPHTQPSRTEMREFYRLVTANDGHRITHKLLGYMAERRRHRARWVGALVETRVPLRLIDGAVDPVSGRHMADRYREIVPAPDVVVLEDVGHYPQIEAPEAVLAAFFAFVDRVRDEPSRRPAPRETTASR